MLYLVVLILGFIPFSHTLTCFENDDKGNIKEVQSKEWRYCGLIPESGHTKGRLFGVGDGEETLTGFDIIFQQSNALYKVLTVCVYEKYDLGSVSPHLGGAEFLFRCMCNYDRCNSHRTFAAYLNNMKRDNA
ncbi:hypothetical protein KIN20_014509 [Parelaphostrongylus tenuis]|uniref:Uncharacterized protein n=1 Tax=Parelaphostrongylus tenuis TaxID=148309 RepID=A0AAD5MIH2_PARTN|nr:hypothetical protein KIN20_014509 [Parelaphostrongylus tenuis]